MKKAVKNTISVILAVAIFISIGIFLGYLLNDDSKTSSRLVFHDLYDPEEKIETVFLGSSHVYRSLDPRITDELMGENTFDLSTSVQRIDGSYAILKEACKYHDIRHVYLEMYNHVIWDRDPFTERVEMQSTYDVSDYMRLSADKISLILNSSAPEYYSNSFILARRNWEKIFDPEYVMDLYELKHSEAYLDYEWVNKKSKDRYEGKGYLASDKVRSSDITWLEMTNGNVYAIDNLKNDSDWKKTMLRIIDFCSRKNIELTLFTAPEPDYEIFGKKNYQEFIDTVQELADAYGLEFYDFNLVRHEYFDTADCSLFMDENHLNDSGAAIFSNVFGNFFSGKISEEELFYRNVEEKRASVQPQVYGLAMFWPAPEGYDVPFIVSSRDEGIEYKIEITSKETGETRLYQDFDENNMIWMPQNEKAAIKVTWRADGTSSENEFQLEYPYK